MAEMYPSTSPWIQLSSGAGGDAADNGRPDGNDRLNQVHDGEDVDHDNENNYLQTGITATTNNYTIIVWKINFTHSFQVSLIKPFCFEHLPSYKHFIMDKLTINVCCRM